MLLQREVAQGSDPAAEQTLPRIPQSTSNRNTQVKTSMMVKNTNPNLQEVTRSRVLDTGFSPGPKELLPELQLMARLGAELYCLCKG